MSIRGFIFWTFISENLQLPLIFLVPSLAWKFEKMMLFSQKYHVVWNYNNNNVKHCTNIRAKVFGIFIWIGHGLKPFTSLRGGITQENYYSWLTPKPLFWLLHSKYNPLLVKQKLHQSIRSHNLLRMLVTLQNRAS